MYTIPTMKKLIVILATITVLGLLLRLWHIEFGLPHSFYADEPEIAELAIKYTYEIKGIISQKDYFKLIPISFVYGTFPTYLLTLATMFFSKTVNILSLSIDKTNIYIFLRSFSAVLSFFIVPTISYLYFKLFKDKLGTVITFVLLALNWKLIVHAHYINTDIILTLLTSLSFLSLYNLYKSEEDTKWTVLTGVLVGLSIGTKFTAGLTLPLYIYILLKRKDWKTVAGFILVIFATFMISNPFSLIFANDFIFRIWEMLTKEGGLVFDSVDSSPFKYISALAWVVSPLILLLSLYGKWETLKKSEDKPFHIFLILNVVFYIVFYSIQSRRVDRWLLPIIPIVLLYAARGVVSLRKKLLFLPFIVLIAISYLYFPILLLTQFQKNTPKSAAYIWVRDNLPPSANKLVYTEEGLDPMNKLLGERVIQYQVYESENAQFFIPEDPDGYDYVILSSRPMQNFKRKQVRDKFPFYAEKWDVFENKIYESGNFKLIKSFELSKPNLIPLSDIFIYENINPPTIKTL